IDRLPLLEELVNALARVKPASARLAMLDGIERCPAIANVTSDVAHRFDLLLRFPASVTRERNVMQLRRVEACRLIGWRKQARARLQQLVERLEFLQPFAARLALLAFDRIGWTSADARYMQALHGLFVSEFGQLP